MDEKLKFGARVDGQFRCVINEKDYHHWRHQQLLFYVLILRRVIPGIVLHAKTFSTENSL